MKDVLLGIVGSTGWLGTIFSVSAMMTASAFLWFKPELFTPDHWLKALGTCAGLIGGVVLKRALDNTKLAKEGVGDGGK